jgi:uncharacterized repeat protein (TIGR03943 family)
MSVAVAVHARWSPVRVATGLVLAAWGALFWMLLVTGRTYLYLSTRTAWLVPMGAGIFTLAAIGRLVTGRTTNEESLDKRSAWSLGLIVMPVVLVLALPPATLGTYSVGKRATFGGSAIGATARDVTEPLDFVDIGAAQSFPDAMRQLEDHAGEPITLEGFVTKEASAPDQILLTRYIVTCCVADATVAQARIVGLDPAQYLDDEWIRVTGFVFPFQREVYVQGQGAEQIPVPEQPYLTP